MAPVQHRLAVRKRQPDQRIEQVVAVSRPGGDFAAAKGALLVALDIIGWQHEAQLHAAASQYSARGGHGI
jgi:hypothetical protein